MKIALNYRGKKIVINEVYECKGIWKYVGLMFKSKNGAKTLVFDFGKPSKKAIHSFFVFFSFLAIWLDDKGKIVEVRKVGPFQPLIVPKKEFSKLIEIPLNNSNREIYRIIDDTERFK